MITLEAPITSQEAYPALRRINAHLSWARNRLFVDVFIKKKSVSDAKREAARYGLSNRHFSSLIKELQGDVQSIRGKRLFDIKDRKTAVDSLEKKIKKLNTDIKRTKSDIKSIRTYKEKVQRWKALTKTKRKKPKLKADLKDKDLSKLEKELSKAKFSRHQKKRRLEILKRKVTKLEAARENGELSLAFGGKKRLKKQHNLSQNGYTDHAAWLRDYRFHRTNQSLWVGTHSEPMRNQNASYCYESGTLRLRVPLGLESELGKYILLENIYFVNKQDKRAGHKVSPRFVKAFDEKRILLRSGKPREVYVPFTYRLLERSPGVFVVQASFEPHEVETKTSTADGVIGLDLNADHIALGEIDRFGNPIRGLSFPLRVGSSSQQAEAVMQDHLSDIFDYAIKQRKNIVVEKLDFTKKKAKLREDGGPGYARMLSSFAYERFSEAIDSKGARLGVQVSRVNPAYSSIIGSIKYSGHKGLSSHERAAIIIARRSFRFSERAKVHGTREETASILGAHDPRCFALEASPRHVWSYYVDLKKKESAALRGLQTKARYRVSRPPCRPSSASAFGSLQSERLACASPVARGYGNTA